MYTTQLCLELQSLAMNPKRARPGGEHTSLQFLQQQEGVAGPCVSVQFSDLLNYPTLLKKTEKEKEKKKAWTNSPTSYSQRGVCGPDQMSGRREALASAIAKGRLARIINQPGARSEL